MIRDSQQREVTFPMMPKKEVELKSKPPRSRIQVCAFCSNLRAANQALCSHPHGWKGIHRLFVPNYFHYRNQQLMSREKSASREGNRMSCLSCRVIMRPNQYFGNTLPFLSFTSRSKSPWERAHILLPCKEHQIPQGTRFQWSSSLELRWSMYDRHPFPTYTSQGKWQGWLGMW